MRGQMRTIARAEFYLEGRGRERKIYVVDQRLKRGYVFAGVICRRTPQIPCFFSHDHLILPPSSSFLFFAIIHAMHPATVLLTCSFILLIAFYLFGGSKIRRNGQALRSVLFTDEYLVLFNTYQMRQSS